MVSGCDNSCTRRAAMPTVGHQDKQMQVTANSSFVLSCASMLPRQVGQGHIAAAQDMQSRLLIQLRRCGAATIWQHREQMAHRTTSDGIALRMRVRRRPLSKDVLRQYTACRIEQLLDLLLQRLCHQGQTSQQLVAHEGQHTRLPMQAPARLAAWPGFAPQGPRCATGAPRYPSTPAGRSAGLWWTGST